MDKVRKLQLATDYYQLSVSNVYASMKGHNKVAIFDVFIRKNPFGGGYCVFSGLEEVIEYIKNLHFDMEDIQLLRKNHPELTEDFLNYLKNFKFSGEIYAMEEGEIFFPMEPILRVKADLIQAQLIETTILSVLNHQSLIATKASRVCYAAGDIPVLDFGLRRAHGHEAGLFGSKASIIGGCSGTSNVECEYRWEGIVSKGTISHSYIMSFDSELEAFRTYANYNPNNVILLVDTYDTLQSGVQNAIKVFSEQKKKGLLNGVHGIRLDSGDLAYLANKARKMLDEAGFESAIISASSDLDENIISNLKMQGAKIDLYGVGTKMMTGYDNPALGGVYKLSGIIKEKDIIPKMKISNDPIKITNPGYKKVVRCYDKNTNMAIADLILLEDEKIDSDKPLKIYHPMYTWKNRTISNFYTRELLKPIFVNGECVYSMEPLDKRREKCREEKNKFWTEYLRLVNPSEYHVDISDKLYEIKKGLLDKNF